MGCNFASAQLNTDRITAIGRNALYFEDYVLSIQYFNQVIRIKPYLAEPYQLRAIAKIQLGDYRGAMQDCNKAIDLNPFQPSYYYTRGFIYRNNQQWDEAENDFTKALSLSPENKTYLILRADVRSAQKNYSGALADLDYVLVRDPQSATLHFEKGQIALQMEDTVQSRECFRAATTFDSQNPQNWSALGMTDLLLNDENEAIAHITRAINLGTKWSGDYINRGILFYRKHNYRSAMSDYDLAVSIDPENGSCYYNRAMLRQELGDYNNALADYDKAIELSSDPTQMRYQRATVLMQLRQWKQAIEDFDALIERYPTFLPSYYLAAQAHTELGHTKDAYRYRMRAEEMEKNPGKKPSTSNQIASSQPAPRDHRKEFSARTAQNGVEDPNGVNDQDINIRGAIQNQRSDVVNQPNIVLSYYAQNSTLRRTNYYHNSVAELNYKHILPSQLQFTGHEIPLDADMVAKHFDAINQLTKRIEIKPTADLYFQRSIEFALVQDYSSALDDITKAIVMYGNKAEAYLYFCRANWRFKWLEYQRVNGTLTAASPLDFDIMQHDYDYVIELSPTFSFAYYNKANMLCIQRDYEAAIRQYTAAIAQDPDFAEAYFNRGLTYIFLNQQEAGLADLSSAGELGIYQAYHLISRLQ